MRDRRQIIDTAVSLFRSKGYEAVTVSEICRECDIAYGTFFNQFKTKGNLLWEYVFGSLIKDQIIFREIREERAINRLMKMSITISKIPTQVGAPLMLQFLTLRIQNHEYWTQAEALFEQRVEVYCEMIAQAQRDGDILNRSKPETLLRSVRDMMLATQINWAADPSFDFEERFAGRVETLLDIRSDLRRYTRRGTEE